MLRTHIVGKLTKILSWQAQLQRLYTTSAAHLASQIENRFSAFYRPLLWVRAQEDDRDQQWSKSKHK
jgi:hypothetical protein